MDLKKLRKNIAYSSGRVAMEACSLIVRCLPAGWVYGFAQGLAGLAYIFARKHRRVALESLTIAFGNDKTPVERAKIAKASFIAMAKSGVELVFLMDKPELISQRVSLSGEEHLKAALQQGKGVILVSAHFGNFPLLMARLSLAGYKTAGIMRPMRDTRTEDIFLAKRQRLNIKTIYSQPRNTCVQMTIKTLRDNELVFIPLDQNFGTGGVFVNFFGRQAATATGPVILAQRTQAALVPCFIRRTAGDRHVVMFEKQIPLEEGATPDETVTHNVQRITTLIETYIRRYPEEWGWIHRRWKAQPRR